MEFVGKILFMAVMAIFVQNFVLMRFLGLCPYIGVSKKLDSALGMGMAVIFVMTMASTFTWLIHTYLLVPLHLEFLQTIAFILTIASLVQLVEMIIQKTAPALYKSLGVFLPLITTNCAVLGVAILTVQKDFNLMEGVVFAIANAIGFTLAIVLFSGIREHLDLMEVPKGMRGVPIALVVAGILALAFMGFTGLV